jgi:hypothetical protein
MDVNLTSSVGKKYCCDWKDVPRARVTPVMLLRDIQQVL